MNRYDDGNTLCIVMWKNPTNKLSPWKVTIHIRTPHSREIRPLSRHPVRLPIQCSGYKILRQGWNKRARNITTFWFEGEDLSASPDQEPPISTNQERLRIDSLDSVGHNPYGLVIHFAWGAINAPPPSLSPSVLNHGGLFRPGGSDIALPPLF